MENLLLWGFYFLTFYAFLPGLISRIFGFRVFKKGLSDRDIALTFDDGPDPVYTPILLDLLKRHGVKATFFVVGVNAEKHPDIIKRMHDEGHVIGIHNYVHKSNWLMRPGTVKEQIRRTAELIESITGKKPCFYRPPWGIVNLFDFSNLGYLQIILWSSLFGDWRKRVGPVRMRKRIMKKIRGGEVLLLHDCGQTLGADSIAPKHMIEALDLVLEDSLKQGFRFIRIDEMIRITDSNKAKQLSPAKKVAVTLWLAWEKVFHVLFRLQPVQEKDTVFHIRVRKYSGQTLVMNDGETLNKGDRIVELHLDNNRLFEMGMKSRSTMHTAIQLIRAVEKGLPPLAKMIGSDPQYDDVKAVYGVSMINRGSEQFGFTVLDLPQGPFAFFTRIYLRLLLRVIHPSGKNRLRDRSVILIPKILVMSMNVLRDRFSMPKPVVPAEKPVKEPAKEPVVLSLAADYEQGIGKTPPAI